MDQVSRRFGGWASVTFLLLALAAGVSSVFAAPQANTNNMGSAPAKGSDSSSAATQSTSPSGNMAAPKATTKPGGSSSSQDIAAAKASGKVWVNTDSGVYHKGGRWYGKTKAGKFMTESEAKAAGYKAAHKE
jgi:uncharacterized iron-regulated membrane protein